MKRKNPFLLAVACVASILLCVGSLAQGPQRDGGRAPRPGKGGGPRQTVPTFTPTQPVDVVLGRPTDTSVVLSVLRYDRDGSVVVAWGTRRGTPAARTASVRLGRGLPGEIVLRGLARSTSYHYQVLDVATPARPLAEGTFHTARAPGRPFTFTVTADSHLDSNTDPLLYQATLDSAKADAPDFHVDLGDTFMTDKHESRENADRQYCAQRFHLARLGLCVPLFLALGNHDGEGIGRSRDGSQDMASWSNAMRRRYFPNPAPDGFYTGNATAPLQDYYAWHWGDALFVVLDPYRYSTGRNDDGWGLSLGKDQYAWLRQTLAHSRARFKFVFIHQLVGGLAPRGRGGKEAASFGEWGGRNVDGSAGFAVHRPGWDMPIHRLLVRHRVTIVFHGHDHLFARQALDGVVYQEVPQPGRPGKDFPRFAEEAGYRDGVILGGSGYLRMSVSPRRVTADYVVVERRADADARAARGTVSHSYTLGE